MARLSLTHTRQPPRCCVVKCKSYSPEVATFSERIGINLARSAVQVDDLDKDTRTALWNVLVQLQMAFRDIQRESWESDATQRDILDSIWGRRFRKPMDERPTDAAVWQHIKQRVLSSDWHEVLDIVEAVQNAVLRYKSERYGDVETQVARAFDEVFEDHLVGYRFVGSEITPVHSRTEADAITAAIAETDQFAGARHALERALSLLSDRANPDYPNSIKESISAVEAIVKVVTGAKTLGDGLKKLEDAGLHIHQSLREAWSKMYGWTSDGPGIRHGAIERAAADQAMAKYVLVTCSAFVSYLIEKGRAAGLL